MKKSLILLAALISMFYYSERAQAAFLLEPYAGMEFNSTASNDNSDYKISGTSVGARGGFQNLGFMFGLDGRRSSWTLKPDSGSDDDWSFTTLGLFVGYDFPILLRVWGEYVISHNGENDDKVKLTDGSGMIFGIGYKIMPFVSLNFEIANLKTTKIESASGTESDRDQKYNSYLLGISIPLSI